VRKLLDNAYFILVLRVVFAGIFLWASVDKIIDPAAFSKSINNYHIVPGPFVNIFALSLPWVEALVGIGLLTGIWGKASAWLTQLMMIMFTIALFIAISKGVSIDCGCFSQNPEVKGSLMVAAVRDIVMIIFITPMLISKARGFGWK
jgi:putative oxidoreductase